LTRKFKLEAFVRRHWARAQGAGGAGVGRTRWLATHVAARVREGGGDGHRQAWSIRRWESWAVASWERWDDRVA